MSETKVPFNSAKSKANTRLTSLYLARNDSQRTEFCATLSCSLFVLWMYVRKELFSFYHLLANCFLQKTACAAAPVNWTSLHLRCPVLENCAEQMNWDGVYSIFLPIHSSYVEYVALARRTTPDSFNSSLFPGAHVNPTGPHPLHNTNSKWNFWWSYPNMLCQLLG